MIIRWVCGKCNKKWIYPIEKCVYCKSPITKQKGAKIKVAGITKVNIPSPMHPVIPYNILLLEDEFGNRMPRKTMKDYKIGDDFVLEKAKTKDAVSVVKVKYDVYEAVKECIGLLDFGLEKDDKILVKPSIIASAYPYQAVNTNPEFLDALFDILSGYGIKKENIIVAEQALIGSDAIDAASKSGIIEVCKKHGINFIDISKGPFEEIDADGFKFKVHKEALRRKVINAPIMKTNFQLGISGALENLSRLTDEKTQREMYYNNIEITLPKLAKYIGSFTVADATNGLQAQGPLTLGEPAFLNLVYASNNPAALDSIFCEATMMDIPYYVSNSLSTGAKSIEIVGNDLDAFRYPLKQSLPHETPHPDIKVFDGKSCPACLNLLYGLTSKLIGLRGDEISMVTGSMIDEGVLKKERVVVLGDCAIKKLGELGIKNFTKIEENLDIVEQIVLLKKLLETKGSPKITPVDRVKSKIKKLLSRVTK